MHAALSDALSRCADHERCLCRHPHDKVEALRPQDLNVSVMCRTLPRAMAWVRWEGSCTCAS